MERMCARENVILREENVRTRLELLMQEIQNRNAAGD